MNFKICKSCQEELPASKEYFHKDKTGKLGLHFYCKNCRSKKQCPERWKRIDLYNQGLKKCFNCQEIKLLIRFSKNKSKKNKLEAHCKECRLKYNKQWRQNNLKYQKEYQKEYRQKKPHINSANIAKYRAAKLSATPKWLDKRQLNLIECFYMVRDIKSKVDGIEYHIDHIVPLQGENVSGLHVPWNLQILTAEENLSKHNKLA